MQRRLRFIAAVFVIAIFLAGSLGAKTIRIETPGRQMSVREARKALAESLGKLSFVQSVDGVRCNRQSLRFVAVFNFGPASKNSGRPIPCRITFTDFEKVTLVSMGPYWDVRAKGKVIAMDEADAISPFFENQQAARAFVDAVLVLKLAALSPDTEESDYAAFTADAKRWRDLASNPPMSTDARRYRLLAEDAFQRKNLAAALDAYVESLDRHPMWPEGHYNAALLAAETEDYERAAFHMRRYLALAPDARDATASEDKLLLWQLKSKE